MHELGTGAASKNAAQWLALDLARQTDNAATHPCLTDRLAALGYTITANSLPAPLTVSAALSFLGDALPEMTAHLDQFWKQEEAKAWDRLHAHKQHQNKSLARLEAKAQSYPLSVEEIWKRADLTWQLRNPESAIPLLRAVLAQSPQHPMANNHLGQILLDRNDSSGVRHLEIAMDRDPALVIPACQRLYAFFRQQENRSLAEKYQQRWRQHEKLWKLARKERTQLTEQDHFSPHRLPEAEVKQLAEQLSEYSEVKAAYLVQKQVTRFPEKSFYGLGIVRRYYRGEGPTYKTDSELTDQLSTEISFSGELEILILNRATMNLWRILRKVSGAMIYQY